MGTSPEVVIEGPIPYFSAPEVWFGRCSACDWEGTGKCLSETEARSNVQRHIQGRHGVEQRRRDFMAAQPELYAYIEAMVSSRVLNSAGNYISGYHEAANRVWHMSANAKRAAQRARESEFDFNPRSASD